MTEKETSLGWLGLRNNTTQLFRSLPIVLNNHTQKEAVSIPTKTEKEIKGSGEEKSNLGEI